MPFLQYLGNRLPWIPVIQPVLCAHTVGSVRRTYSGESDLYRRAKMFSHAISWHCLSVSECFPFLSNNYSSLCM